MPGSPLSAILLLLGAWVLIGLAGLLRPTSLAFAGRSLFPLGAVCGIVIAVVAVASLAMPPEQLQLRIGLPDLSMHVRLDALSGVFLFLLGASSAGISLFGAGYFRSGQGTPPGLLCLQYHLFLASMGMLLLADDAYAFMVAWETMALSSYFLVTSQHRIAEIRRAGFLYLTMAHVGALVILLCFGVMQGGSWHFTFDAMRAARLTPQWAGAAFLLALFGFGMKGGLVPLHVWLPEAHPAAPSPVSALMSGVMLKMAVYGMLRVSFDLLAGPRLVVGTGADRHRIVHGAVRHRIRRGANRYEAAAGVFVDREHRYPVHRPWPRDGVSRRRHAEPRRACAAGGALPLDQPRVHEEPAVSRHGLGAAFDRRAQPGAPGRV